MQHIFDIVTKQLSISITFELLSVPNGLAVIARLVLDQSWTVTIKIEFVL